MTTGYGSAINNGQSTTLLKSGTEGKNFQILNYNSKYGKYIITTTNKKKIKNKTKNKTKEKKNIK